MDEAIELAIAEESPYPEQSAFLNTDMPGRDEEMERVAREGYSVVLVSPGGDIRIIPPKEILGAG